MRIQASPEIRRACGRKNGVYRPPKKFGGYTAKLILDDMLKKNIIRKNPLTSENKPFFKPKGVFDF